MTMIVLSQAYYIGSFAILIICILCLVIMSPSPNSFFDLKEVYPSLFYIIHNNTTYMPLITEIVNVAGIDRIDIEPQNTCIQTTKSDECEIYWMPYMNFTYVRGCVSILPLYFNNEYYTHNINKFDKLMTLLYLLPKVINVFFWRLGAKAALLEHAPYTTDNKPNIYEHNILGCRNILRYTLAINVLSCTEEDCSLWVDGHLRTLIYDKYVVWNPNKSFSLHNDGSTDGDTLFLNIDFERE